VDQEADHTLDQHTRRRSPPRLLRARKAHGEVRRFKMTTQGAQPNAAQTAVPSERDAFSCFRSIHPVHEITPAAARRPGPGGFHSGQLKGLRSISDHLPGSTRPSATGCRDQNNSGSPSQSPAWKRTHLQHSCQRLFGPGGPINVDGWRRRRGCSTGLWGCVSLRVCPRVKRKDEGNRRLNSTDEPQPPGRQSEPGERRPLRSLPRLVGNE